MKERTKSKKVKRNRAFFITLEGGEGSGKSSVISSLTRYLRKAGYKVIVFREPGSTRVGEKIRTILLDKRNNELGRYTELLLYLAARTQLIEEKLIKSFKKYDFVICDRFFDSTLVYQGYALGLGETAEVAVEMFRLGVVPDVTLILDTDVRGSLKRLRSRDRIESRVLQFHRRLKQGYRKLARRYPERIRLIAAEGKLNEVCQKVQEVVDDFLCRKKRRVS